MYSEDIHIWDFAHPDELVSLAYNNDNILIEDNPKAKTNLCYIFFSSNGVIINEKKKFEQEIAKGNRYEWKNISKNYLIRRKAKRLIFVRDIYVQWYITGINSRINTIEKLADSLRELTNGMEIVTVGTSSGGYMATLMGIKLGAKHVLNFSGQYILNEEGGPLVKKALQHGYAYANIINLVKSKQIPIFYFVPYESMQDVEQYELVKNIDNVKSIRINTNQHGKVIHTINIPFILSKKTGELFSLYERGRHIVWKQNAFLWKSANLVDLFLCGLNYLYIWIKKDRG